MEPCSSISGAGGGVGSAAAGSSSTRRRSRPQGQAARHQQEQRSSRQQQQQADAPATPLGSSSASASASARGSVPPPARSATGPSARRRQSQETQGSDAPFSSHRTTTVRNGLSTPPPGFERIPPHLWGMPAHQQLPQLQQLQQQQQPQQQAPWLPYIPPTADPELALAQARAAQAAAIAATGVPPALGAYGYGYAPALHAQASYPLYPHAYPGAHGLPGAAYGGALYAQHLQPPHYLGLGAALAGASAPWDGRGAWPPWPYRRGSGSDADSLADAYEREREQDRDQEQKQDLDQLHANFERLRAASGAHSASQDGSDTLWSEPLATEDEIELRAAVQAHMQRQAQAQSFALSYPQHHAQAAASLLGYGPLADATAARSQAYPPHAAGHHTHPSLLGIPRSDARPHSQAHAHAHAYQGTHPRAASQAGTRAHAHSPQSYRLSSSDAAALRQAQARASFTGAVPPVPQQRGSRARGAEGGEAAAHAHGHAHTHMHIHTVGGGGAGEARRADTKSTTSSLLRHPAFHTRYFILKAHDVEDIHTAMRTGRWTTQAHNRKTLDQAYRCSESVILVFGANHAGQFAACARMASRVGGKREKELEEEDADEDARHVQPVRRDMAEIGTAPSPPAAAQNGSDSPRVESFEAAATRTVPAPGSAATLPYPMRHHWSADDIHASGHQATSLPAPGKLAHLSGQAQAQLPSYISSSGDLDDVDVRAYDAWSIEARIQNLAIDELEARSERERLVETLRARYGQPEAGAESAVKEGADAEPSAEAAGAAAGLTADKKRRGSVAPSESEPTHVPSSSASTVPAPRSTTSGGYRASETSGLSDLGDDGESGVDAGSFAIDWVIKRPVPFHAIRNLRNPWREDRQIKVSRDGTELEPSVGKELLEIWMKLPADGCNSCGRAKPRLLETED